MTTPIFVDTSAWYALGVTRDPYHGQASRLLRQLITGGRRLVTTNHIVAETYTLLHRRLGAVAAREFLDNSRLTPSLARFHVPEPWEDAAEEVLRQFHDQDFSYVDATSFIVMRRLRLQEAFTYDHHFAVMGFVPIG